MRFEGSPGDKGRDLQCIYHSGAVLNTLEVRFATFEHYHKE